MQDNLDTIETGAIDDCARPVTMVLRDYWQAMYAAENGVPKYRNVDLMDLHKIAHLIFVKDVINDGEDFVNRFWGTELRRTVGFEATGVRVSEYEPTARRDRLLVRYRTMTRDRIPVLRRAGIKHLDDKKHLTYEVLNVPFLDPDGEKVSQIMAAYEFHIHVAP